MIDNWSNSKAFLARARNSIPGGVNSGVRARAPIPLYFQDGCGCRVRDVDGNEYIDYALAWGPLILGHRHPRIVEALRRAIERPHMYGAQHELEFRVAEKLQSLVPCAERVVFSSTGTEAVQLALRLARAFTRRNLIVKFEGHYHGWIDSVLVSYHPTESEAGNCDEPRAVLGSVGQIADAGANLVIVPWNRPQILADVFRERGSDIAAVIMEPVLCNSGCLMPLEGYIQAVSDLCRAHSSLLIFDEVITGFRMSLGGAQEAFNITPDIATFGKALAGGATLSAVAGKRQILDLLAFGEVLFGGTYNGNPLSLTCAEATLDVLSQDGGSPIANANRVGRDLMSGIHEAAARHSLPLRISGFGAAFSLHFTERCDLTTYRDVLYDEEAKLKAFVRGALEEGLYLLSDGRIYVSAVHGNIELERTLPAISRVFERMCHAV